MLTAPSGPIAQADDEDSAFATTELELGGMHCSACATRIERALAQLPGVRKCIGEPGDDAGIRLLRPAAVSPDDLCQAVDEAGYSAAVAERRRRRG